MLLAELIDGFQELITEIEEIANTVTSKELKIKAMKAGSDIVVARAKRIISQHKRTGTLESGIGAEYNEKTQTMDIGWSKEAFYGAFLDDGFQHIGGKPIQIQHLKSSYESEKNKVFQTMIETYRNELR